MCPLSILVIANRLKVGRELRREPQPMYTSATAYAGPDVALIVFYDRPGYKFRQYFSSPLPKSDFYSARLDEVALVWDNMTNRPV